MIIENIMYPKNAHKLATEQMTHEVLREILSYDPETGLFHWLVRTANRVQIGRAAGALTHGYITIGYKTAHHRAHRLAFLYMTGEWPKHEVDHINTIRRDNRWINLRDVRHIVNMQNKHHRYSNNTSGAMGVSWAGHGGKWQAQIWIDGASQVIGYYSTIAEASDAYQEVKRTIHPGYVPAHKAAPTDQMRLAF